MKRSEYIAIGAVGLLAVAALWPRNVTSVGGSMDDDIAADAQAFSTVAECSITPGMTQAACDSAFAAAQQNAVAAAPRYDNQSSCEAQYGAGQCRTSTWNGASVFVPALVGMMVGRAMANAGQPRVQPLFPPRTGLANCPQGAATPNRPECGTQARSGVAGAAIARSFSTGNGTAITRTSGADSRLRVDARPRSSVSPGGSTMSRSGFGSTASSRSIGG